MMPIPCPGPIVLPPILSSSDEALEFMEETGLYIMAIFALLIIVFYAFVFLKKWIRFLKMKESKYISDDILDFLEISMKGIWGLLVAYTCLLLLALGSDWFLENVWWILTYNPVTGTGYLAPIMWCVMVTAVVGLSIKFVQHILQYEAGNLKDKPEKPMNPRIALLIEIFLKYFLIIFGVALIITIALTAIGYYEQIVGGMLKWLDNNKADIIFIVFIIILAYFLVKIFETFFEDMKKKETPFSPQIMDLGKVLSRYTIYIIVGITVIFSLLQMFALGQTGIIIVGVIIVLLALIVAVAATSNLRNGFSGMILMAFKPFDEGDRIRILEDLVCDVINLGIIFTRVRTLRGEIVDIPNNEILNRPILNYSKSDDYAISLTVSVPSDVDREDVKELLVSSALETEGILENLTPEVFAIGMGHDNVVLELMAYTITPRRLKHIKSDLIHKVSSALDENEVPHSVHIADIDEVEKMRSVKGQKLRRITRKGGRKVKDAE